jgi:hypothetical protein
MEALRIVFGENMYFKCSIQDDVPNTNLEMLTHLLGNLGVG